MKCLSGWGWTRRALNDAEINLSLNERFIGPPGKYRRPCTRLSAAPARNSSSKGGKKNEAVVLGFHFSWLPVGVLWAEEEEETSLLECSV